MYRSRGKHGEASSQTRGIDRATHIMGNCMGHSIYSRTRLAFAGALLLPLLLLAPAHAAVCSPTPSLQVWNYPGASRIPKNNDLVMPAGKALAAEGQQVVIYGQLLDPRCIPITDAVIELWQVDPYGQWLLATPGDLVSPNAIFAGAGRARSDSNGRFHFITLFPAATKERIRVYSKGRSSVVVRERAPHFDLRITVPGQKPFTTALYFADDGRNARDFVLQRIKPEQRARVSMQVNEAGKAGLGAAATIVLPYKARYRTY